MSLTILAAILHLAFPPASTNAFDSETVATVSITNLFTNVKELTVTLEHDPSPTANLEIGIGTDKDGNGTLDLLECDRIFASDCGVRSVRDNGGRRLASEEGVWTLSRREIDTRWNALRLVRRGTGEFNENARLTTRPTGLAFILK